MFSNLGSQQKYSFIFWIALGGLLGFLQLQFDYFIVFLAGGTILLFLVFWAFPLLLSKLKHLWTCLNLWHWLWFLSLLSGLGFRIRDATSSSENPLDAWALYRIFLVAIIGIIVIYQLTFKHVDWPSTLSRGPLGLLGLYSLFSLASTIWSVYPGWTLYKSIEYFIDLALLACIVNQFRTYQQMKSLFDWTWLLLIGLLCTTWVGVLIWPTEALSLDVGSSGMQIKGVFPMISSNNVGELSAIVASVFLTRYLYYSQNFSQRKTIYLLIFGFGLLTLIASQTRSAFGGFFVAIFLLLLVQKRFGIIFLSPLILAIVLTLTPATSILTDFFQRGQSTEQVSSLTGRTIWWAGAWDAFLEQPFSGFGAYAAGRFLVLANQGFEKTASLHSTWMELLVGLGIPGILLVLGSVLWLWKILFFQALSWNNQSAFTLLTTEAIVVFGVTSVRSIFESAFIWHPSLPFLLIVGYSEFLRRSKPSQNHECPTHSQLLSASRR
ncbi:O-antigen ligase family protein [Candidatus Nitrospira salsa]